MQRGGVSMKLTIFGATGRTGRPLVEQALEQGHEVTALARDRSKLGVRHGRLAVVEGDVMDLAAVDRAVAGAEAVLSVIGRRKDSPEGMQTAATENIVAAMKKHGVKRLVSLTGAGVRDPRDEPKLFDRAITALLKLLQREVLEDAEGHARVIEKSGLDWIIVRGPMLNEGEKKGTYRVGYVGKNSGTKISRADVAGFMLRQVEDDAHLRQKPMISY
jgi:putative NADH-flavin reductase